MDTLHRVEINGISFSQAISLVRLVWATVGVSLVEAKRQPRPHFPIPAMLLSLGRGNLALYASPFAVVGYDTTTLDFCQAHLPSPAVTLVAMTSSIGERVEAQ